MKKILIIVPAYNEQDSITDFINKLKDIDIVVDILVVNDCSIDSTALICGKLSNIEIVSLPFNLGIGGAVQTGYLYALRHDYDIAVQMDGDGQHNPDYLAKLISPIQQDQADFVIGSRFVEKTEGFNSTFLRRVGINFFSYLINSNFAGH